MNSKNQRPMWVILYLIAAGFLAAMWWAARAPLTDTEREIAEIGLMVAFWWSINGWLRENEAAILMADLEKKRRRQAVDRRMEAPEALKRNKNPILERTWQSLAGWAAAVAAALAHGFRGN